MPEADQFERPALPYLAPPDQGKDAPPDRPRFTPTPARRRWHMALSVARAPFANRDGGRLRQMLDALKVLIDERPASVRFSNHTGVVHTLRGYLFPEARANEPEDMLVIAEKFLQQHRLALLGVDAIAWRPDSYALIGNVARLRQTDMSGKVPVYGGTMAFGFDSDMLTMITNSFYPVNLDDYSSQFPADRDAADAVAKQAVIEFVRKTDTTTRPKSRQETNLSDVLKLENLTAVPADELEDGRVVFPGLVADKPRYYAAWAILVAAKEYVRSWEVIVDAESYQVLDIRDATLRALSCWVYPNNAAVAAQQGSLRQLGAVPAAGQLGAAPDFRLYGPDFAEPAAGSPPFVPPPGSWATQTQADARNRFRSGNIYYHLVRARTTFDDLLTRVWSALPANAWSAQPARRPTLPGSAPGVPVQMISGRETGRYDFGSRSFVFGRGIGNNIPPIGDPALDSEVIHHEYTHAVLHVVQPDLFLVMPYAFNNALNEGTAFYYGCTLSERPDQPAVTPRNLEQWGEGAYVGPWLPFRTLQPALSSQRPGYDYLPIYNLFPSYGPNNRDPDGATFACGMLWARTLWDIQRVLGYDIADALVLAGMVLNVGIQSELETPAEAIIHADAYIGGASHEGALRLIFCSRGIMADAPVDGLVVLQLGGITIVIVATEQTESGSGGCRVKLDNVPVWQPLGAGGPQQVVTLAAVADQTHASLWAAGERQGGNQPAPIYRYDFDATLNLNNRWRQEQVGSASGAAQLNGLDILSIAAMPQPNVAAPARWLFIGTERGLYRYDNVAGTVMAPNLTDLPQDTPIFGLTLFQDSANAAQTFLAVAYEDGVVALDPANLTRVAAYTRAFGGDYTLSVAADPAQAGHLWAGLAFGGVYHHDPAAATQWQPIPGSAGPIFQLLVPQTLAGTNDGLYGLQNTVWQSFNQVAQNQEAIAGTSVVSLGLAGNTLYAGTAQRGLWSQAANIWQRVAGDLPRIGQIIDGVVPAGTIRMFQGTLAPAAVRTYVLYVPLNAAGAAQTITCNVMVTGGAGPVAMQLFYVAESIDLGQQQWAGIQGPLLVGSGAVAAPAGYYLVALQADQSFATYNFTVGVA